MYQTQKVGTYDFSFGGPLKVMGFWSDTIETYSALSQIFLMKCTENFTKYMEDQKVFCKNISKIMDERCRQK